MKLTEQQMYEVAEKFFEYDYYAIEDNVIFIDGHVSIDTILAAADYIREIQHVDDPRLSRTVDMDGNLTYALDTIEACIKNGEQYSEFRTYWTLPMDFCITTDTLDELKRRGFRIIHRWCDKGTPDESDSYIVAWGSIEEWPYDEQY
jgi:hypothetical protein